MNSTRASGHHDAPARHVPRLALTRTEAAEALGVSVDTLDRAVAPHVRIFRHGRVRLFPVRELERFLDEHAEHVFEPVSRRGKAGAM